MHNARMSHAQRAQTSDGVCFVRAYAKINLTLDVLGRRADGYHDLATVMQTVDLYDTICLSPIEDSRVQLVSTIAELSNDDNLALRAAQLVRQRLAPRQGVLIELYKRIPVAAGLGGGSRDAAAVLRALQQWWQLPLSPSDLLQAGAPGVRLSGTGPTLFAPFSELSYARRVQEQLQTQGYEVYLSRAIHSNEGIVSIY